MTFEIPADILSNLPQDVKDVVLKPEVLAVIESVNKGLVSKRDELLGTISDHRKTLQDLGGLDTIKASLSELIELKKAAPANKDITKTYQEQLEALQLQLKTQKETAATSKVGEVLTSAVKEADGDVDLLMPFIKSRVKHVIADDGTVSIEVLNASGAPMLNSDGKDASVKDLVAEFKGHEKYGRLFGAANIGGSGGRGGSKGLPANPFAKNTPDYNVTKQAEMYRSNKELAITMAAAAGVVLK